MICEKILTKQKMYIVTQGATNTLLPTLDSVLVHLELPASAVLELKRTGTCSIRDYTVQHVVCEPVWNRLELQIDQIFRPGQMWFRTREDNNALTLAYGKFARVLEVADPPIKAMCLPGRWVEVLPFLQPTGHFGPERQVIPDLPTDASGKIWQVQFTGTCFGTIYHGVPTDRSTQRRNVIASKWTLDTRLKVWDKYLNVRTLYECLTAETYAEYISTDLLEVLRSQIPTPMSDGRWYLLPSGRIMDVPS